MNGLKTIAEFHKKVPTVPIAAMSGFFDMAIKLGATGWLHKPFTSRQLIAVVNASIGLGLADDRPAQNRETEQGL
jgi:FixJ family two-component response regulator